MAGPPVILASASAARAALLTAAGLEFRAVPADIDEAAIRQALEAGGGSKPEDVAGLLAETKAALVGARHPDALVIGADQVLVHEGEILAKPASRAAARDQLLRLRGRRHTLVSAAACVENGQTVWRESRSADLVMRDFSTGFLGRYLAAAGERVTSTVGGYEIEGLGIQLFESVEGDLFTIQGLPLLDLLAFLRGRGVIED